jgi:hypothetical protein
MFPKNAFTIQRQWWFYPSPLPTQDSCSADERVQFVTRSINDINAMMVEFLPKFNTAQMIQEDGMKDFLEFSIPLPWKVVMV